MISSLLLITIGTIVRTTESGLGCPNWPPCHVQIVPPAEKTAISEWAYRIIASTAVAFRAHRNDRIVR